MDHRRTARVSQNWGSFRRRAVGSRIEAVGRIAKEEMEKKEIGYEFRGKKMEI
jgi:hypothetical protein